MEFLKEYYYYINYQSYIYVSIKFTMLWKDLLEKSQDFTLVETAYN